MLLEEKIIIITGSTRGIGLTIAKKAAEEGAHIVISGRQQEQTTKIALEKFVPLMPKGAIVAFDELDNPLWPGETMAMLKYYKGNNPKIRRLEFDPYVGYIEV